MLTGLNKRSGTRETLPVFIEKSKAELTLVKLSFGLRKYFVNTVKHSSDSNWDNFCCSFFIMMV